MSSIIISKELSNSNISHPEGVFVDFSNTDDCITLLSSMKAEALSIYDITENKELEHEAIIPVNDHINCTGSNPLVGRQKKLGIDFIDMTKVYEQKNKGVITHSCGNFLNLEFDLPNHYLAHIVIIARTLKIKRISGWLINNSNGY